MDALSSLFRGPRAQGAFVLRMVMEAPWSVEVRDEAPLTIAAVLSGSLRVQSVAEASPHDLGPGHVAILRGPDHYRMVEGAEGEPEIVVYPGQRCEDRQGRSLEAPLMQGVRTWGNDPDGATVILLGTYETAGELGRSMLSMLPPVIVVEAQDLGTPIVELLAVELVRDVPGQEVVLDRTLDLLTVAALRTWFDGLDDEAPAWWRAAADPVVGTALRLLQHQPDHAWTVASLAAEVNVSRATLAKRFGELVGVPPMAYLTEWRMGMAADLLLEPGTTVEGVAQKVGYGSGFALSAAFKRWRGCSPAQHRALAEVS